MTDTKQWVALLDQQYTTVSGKTDINLLLATRRFVNFLESDPQSQRYAKEVDNIWEMHLQAWLTNCGEIREELFGLQDAIRKLGSQIHKHIEGSKEIRDQIAFDASKFILEKIKEANWYKDWDHLTDDLNLDLLHIERPEQTQTGYMVANVLGVTQTLSRLAEALPAEQESSRGLKQQAERLWRKYGSTQLKIKNDWMSSGKCAFEQLRTVVRIMDGEVFIDPEIFKGPQIRPLIPWATLMEKFVPLDLREDAKYWAKHRDTANKSFERDVEPLIKSYLERIFTEMQFLANSRLALQHLVERYKARCENYDWKNMADMIQSHTQQVTKAKKSKKLTRFEFEELLTLHFARYLHDSGYTVHYTPRDGVHEPDLLGNLSNELEPIVVEAKVVGQRYGKKQSTSWIKKGFRALMAYLEKYHNDYGVKDGYLIVFRLGDEKSPMYTFDESEWVVGRFTIVPKIINIGQVNKTDPPILIKKEDLLINQNT